MLLKSKFSLPTISDDFQWSDRLNETLSQIMDFKVSVILGSPGYGKSTSVAYWLKICLPALYAHKNSENSNNDALPVVAWLSLDRGENDVRRFWQYLAGALFNAKAYSNQMIMDAFVNDTERPLKALITPLLNALDQPDESIILVIDDYDLILKEDIHEMMSFFLDYQPMNVRIVLISRTKPPLNVARRCMLDEYIELLPNHFALNLSQTVQLFNQTILKRKLLGALQENSHDAKVLHHLSQGWPAGIKMLALTARYAEHTGFVEHQSESESLPTQLLTVTFSTEASDLMSDYFLEEVFTKLPADTAQFLVYTAHLPTLTADLCDACLTGGVPVEGQERPLDSENGALLALKVSAQTVLQQLVREGVFVEVVDLARKIYRYHSLFQQFLSAYAQRNIPEQIPKLRTHAAHWFSLHNDVEAALDQVLKLEDWHWAVKLIEESGQSLIDKARYGNLKRNLNGLPEVLVESRPMLMLFYIRIWIHEATTHINPVHRYLKKIETILHDTKLAFSSKEKSAKQYGIINQAAWFRMNGEYCFVSSYWARLHGAASHSENISRHSLKIAVEENLPFESPALFSVGMSCYLRGDLKSGAEAVEEAWRKGQVESNFEIVSSAAVRLAWVYQWQGRFKSAIHIYEQTRSWLSSKGVCTDTFICWQNLMLVAYYRELNQLDKATECLDAVYRSKGDDKKLALFVLFVQARLDETKQQFIEADQRLEQVAILYQPIATTMQGFPSIEAARAKLSMLRGDMKAANQWLAKIRSAVDEVSHSCLENQRYRYEEIRITAARIMLMDAFQKKEEKQATNILVDEVVALLMNIEAQASTGYRISNQVTCKILLAVSLFARSQMTEEHYQAALQYYREALMVGAQSGYVRLFIEEFSAQQRLLLLRIDQEEISSDFSEKLMTLIEEDLRRERSYRSGTVKNSENVPKKSKDNKSSNNFYGVLHDEMVEPLSRREMDVLRLINRGLANKAIAETLFVGIGTVKTHVRNILSKYSVKNRTQAVARARQLGVIE